MNRTPVDSSNITSIGYDRASQVLEIEFHHGAVYQYFDVPQHVFDGLMQASSKGTYFAENVKGHYRYVRA
jgi:uncharacterized protein